MATLDSYQEYTSAALEDYAARSSADRHRLFDAVKYLDIERVLDVGCGAGQDLLSFFEKTDAHCVGVDSAQELGKVAGTLFGAEKRVTFVRSAGEKLPFANGSFDVVLCRVALPYMNNRKAIAEVARVLRPKGAYLLKTHAPPFYFAMIVKGLKVADPKMTAYPLICLAGSFWHAFTGKQLEKGFWRGKEIFQTQSYLEKEFKRNGLEIQGYLKDNNPQTPSYLIVKM